MPLVRLWFAGGLLLVAASAGATTLQPTPLFPGGTEDPNYVIPAPRDFTVDAEGNLYIFDYDEYRIRKYDPKGSHIVTFGTARDGSLLFAHLTTIRVTGDQLFALDADGVATFALNGELQKRTRRPTSVICDLPRLGTDGRFVGEQILEDELKVVLTLRDPSGAEIVRLAEHDVREFFPEIEPGDVFFLNPIQARSYHYDFLSDGRIAWMASDRFRLHIYDAGQSRAIVERTYTPIPYPEDERARLQEKKSRTRPPLFLHVPKHYQLVHQLCVGESGLIWIHLMSQERTGLVCLAPTGEELGFYEVEGEFDLADCRIREHGGMLYFMVTDSGQVSVFTVPVP